MADQPTTAGSRLAEIADLAEAIAEDSFPDVAIDPIILIRRKKITLSRGQYGDSFDGMLEHRAGRFHIYCNIAGNRNPARIRFTLSHELGHYFIDDHRQALEAGQPPHPSLSEYQSDNPVEREADHFASNLLMPSARFLRLARKSTPGAPAILALADTFGTSRTSTAIRYVQLDASICALVRWKPDGTATRWFSPSAYRIGFRKIHTAAIHVPRDSATGKVLQRLDPAPATHFEGTTVASQWFPFIRQGAGQDVLTTEYAIPLGEFGALTIVLPDAEDPSCHPMRW
jgi:hypothetical protein